MGERPPGRAPVRFGPEPYQNVLEYDTSQKTQVTTFDELKDAIENADDFDVISLGANIYFDGEIYIPETRGITILGNGYSLVRRLFSPSKMFYYTGSDVSGDMTFYNVRFRMPTGKFRVIDSTTVELLTTDMTLDDHVLNGKYILFFNAYMAPYYYNIVTDNIGNTVYLQNSVSYDSRAMFYVLVSDYDPFFFSQDGRLTNLAFYNCIFETNYGEYVRSNRYDVGVDGLIVKHCVVKGRWHGNAFDGSIQSSVFSDNYFYLTSMDNEASLSILQMGSILYMHRGWTLNNDFLNNVVTGAGPPIFNNSMIYYNDQAGSTASMFVRNNRFTYFQFASSSYIVDLYDTSAGYSHRKRVIVNNSYNPSSPNLTAFVRDYQDNGHIEGVITNNWSF